MVCRAADCRPYQATAGNYYLDTLDYGNGDSIQYEYDKMGRVIKQTYEDGATVSYQYDNNGALATVTDSETGIKTTYYYDFTDRMMKYVESGDGYSHSVGYEYDLLNNLTKIVDTLNGTTRETSYQYDDDNRITSVQTGDSSTSYTYDGLGRISEEQTKDGEAVVLTDSYTFTPNGSNTTTQVATHTIDTAGFDATYTYTYDDNGNILSISDGTYTTGYVYDSQNQLLRENNQKANKTWTWSYDNGGNIKSKSEYTYTTGELGTPADTINYGYDDDWGDLLTSYDGKAITYDDVGNMLTYGWNTYTWKHGRQLASMFRYFYDWTFTYNADGLRTSRSSVEYEADYQYFYNGSKLIRFELKEMCGEDYLIGYMDISYDSNGIPLSADCNIQYYSCYDEDWNEVDYYVLKEFVGTFYYVTNLQGDVIALLDDSGDLIAEYAYDAWGKLLKEQTYIDFWYVARYNPLRYRGYIYDHETGLYYLQSRYYDPEIGRFINADAFTSTGQGFVGNNMFAYCGNNPVGFSDPNGMWKQVSGGWQAQSGDTLWGLAVRLYGNGAMWTSFGFGRDPQTLQVGEIIKTGSGSGYTASSNGGLTITFRDVTQEVNRALAPYIQLGRTMAKLANTTFIYEAYRYGMFGLLVNHGAAWDIKREASWVSTIGTPFPGKGALIIYQGLLMTPESLGNYTYGVLGASFGIPIQTLLNGSVFAALTGGSLNSISGVANELEDWKYIALGYLGYCF